MCGPGVVVAILLARYLICSVISYFHYFLSIKFFDSLDRMAGDISHDQLSSNLTSNILQNSDDSQSSIDPLISELRLNLTPTLNSFLTNSDCQRFLTARSSSIPDAVIMIQNWHEWRHTLLDPIPPYNIRMSPNILLATPSPLFNHPFRSMLPLNHCCVSKNNLPIYWEKTGAIQAIFGEIKKRFTPLELFQYHLQSNELFENRLFHLSKQQQQQQQQHSLDNSQHSNHMSSTTRVTLATAVAAAEAEASEATISSSGVPKATAGATAAAASGELDLHQYIVIFDMKGINLTLEFDSIWYIKQLLEVDQQFYPDRLFKLFILNSPWYFGAIFQIFKPFINPKTCEKIVILGEAYLEALEEFIDIEMIPVEYGGTYPEMVWELTNNSIHGTSLEQIEEFLQHR
jgi:hypothetical protein